ncbi:MAG: SNF2 helicase associated domain-containing protein, partial [Ignavibacteriae bacterium]|nr:SNF2 helicase associated domain-containing protein [Ignavibacteriota bacterium]
HLAALLYYLNNDDYFSPENIAANSQEEETDSNLKNISAINNAKKQLLNIYPITNTPKSNLRSEADVFNKYFSPFIESSAKIEKTNLAKNNSAQFGLAYGIAAKGYHSNIFPLRLRLRKDGTVADKSKIYNIGYNTIPNIDLKEKLILDFLLNRNNALYLGAHNNTKDDFRKREMFNEILTFLSDKEVYFESKYDNYKTINVLENEADAFITIDEDVDDLTLQLSINIGEEQVSNHKNILVVLDNPLWIYVNDKIFKVNNLSYEQLELFINEEFRIVISKEYLALFEKELLPKIVSKLPIVSSKYKIEEINEPPTKKILLEESASNLLIKVKFGYGELDLDYIEDAPSSSIFNENVIWKIIRDNNFEKQAVEEIQSLYVKKISEGVFTPRNAPIDFLLNHFSTFEEMGFEILGQENLTKLKFNTSKPKISFNVTSGIDWFDVETELDYNGTAVPFSELVEAIKQKKKYLKLSDGSSSILPANWIKKFQQTLSLGELSKDRIRFSQVQALALESILNDADDFEVDDKFTEHIDKLKSFEKIVKQSIPKSFKGELRDYQKHGLDWLYFLKEYSFGGILADDMGLGKTIQSIVLLLKEKEQNKNHTTLIVAPTSVVFNWIDELDKFAPTITVLNHTGIDRNKEDNSAFENYDVVITSYGIL